MDYQSVHLSKKEMERFLEIAGGNTTAANTPEEDYLFRCGLIRETMLVTANLSTGATSADMRAVVLTDSGKDYYAYCLNEQKRRQVDTRRFWLGILLTLVGLVITAISLLLQLR